MMSSTKVPPCVCKVNNYFTNFFVRKVHHIVKCMCIEKKLQKVQRQPRDRRYPKHSHASVSRCSCKPQKKLPRSGKFTIEFVDCFNMCVCDFLRLCDFFSILCKLAGEI